MTKLTRESAAITLDPEAFAPNSEFVLIKNSAYRLPQGVRQVQVVAGCAWLSINGHDMFICAGETAELPTDVQDSAVVSAIDRKPLLIAFTL
ncbi:MAG: hypothetical protein DYG88_09945 [Chloroflexi bacterium CFX4]|nr:hypothetical protein [Chloroflexi bacterium CFX4]MDL1923730.1 hypothetical protein [Chloroflexi bacterium CFX3]